MRNDASLTAFRAARDLLLNHREDYDAAVAEFSWPKLGEFNWALDWFDEIAAEHPDRIALRVVGDDGSDEAVSYGAWRRGRRRSRPGCAGSACGAATGCCSCSATSCRCGRSCWRR